jgi:hypothetical protein
MPRHLFLLPILLLALASTASAQELYNPRPVIGFNPETYLVLQAVDDIVIDGVINNNEWSNAPWTSDFVDILGPSGEAPRFQTRVRMLWDDNYFYIAAEMEEPHIWGKLTERDSVIFYDNDFEVFIDPDDDTHLYYELEMNALNTVWDLLLVTPYRDGGPAVDEFDTSGLITAVQVNGTINDPSDVDTGWSVEIAIPWTALNQIAGVACPPDAGDRWRVNFSRVQWQVNDVDGEYFKVPDSHEDNWVWSPQGLVNMHYPEMWGIVEFYGSVIPAPGTTVDINEWDLARWALRQIYYNERDYLNAGDSYLDDWEVIGEGIEAPPGWSWPPLLIATGQSFIAITYYEGMQMIITDDGKVRVTGIED